MKKNTLRKFFLIDGGFNRRPHFSFTDKDVLATLFHLMKTGCIMPIFEDHNMNRKIVQLRRMNKKPYFEFEQTFLSVLFRDKKELSSTEVSRIIRSNVLHTTLLDNIHVISKFPLINKNLHFLLGKYGEAHFRINGRDVNTVELANQFNTTHLRVIFPIFFGVGILLFLLSFLPFDDFGSKMTLLLTGFFLILLPALMYAMFYYSQKIVTFGFEKNIIPYAKEKYEELYEFLIAAPLRDHVFTHEFLPYAIAFGMDTSWNGDFSLDTEVKTITKP